jgi:hypothetical protein
VSSPFVLLKEYRNLEMGALQVNTLWYNQHTRRKSKGIIISYPEAAEL